MPDCSGLASDPSEPDLCITSTYWLPKASPKFAFRNRATELVFHLARPAHLKPSAVFRAAKARVPSPCVPVKYADPLTPNRHPLAAVSPLACLGIPDLRPLHIKS